MIEPIRPNEVGAAKLKVFPPQVIEAFNSLIAEKFVDGSARVKQEEVLAKILSLGTFSRNEIFERGLLNVEAIYREVGWSVEYYKPDYTESGDAYFTFKTKARPKRP